MFDMTELKNAENEIKILEDRLRQHEKIESIGLLTADIAHNLNNILTCISGYSEFIKYNLMEKDIIC